MKWKPPHFTKQDPPILKYKIAWRPGGSRTLGFRQQIAVDPIQCLAYEERKDEHGVRKVFQKDNLEFNITGLTSDLPYELNSPNFFPSAGVFPGTEYALEAG